MVSRWPPRVFLDTNVLFSGLRSHKGPPAKVLDYAASRIHQPVISRTVLDELVRNLRKKAPLVLPRLEWLFQQVEFEVTAEPPPSEVQRLTALGFESDAPILAAAVAAQVDFICTGDRRFRERLGSLAAAGIVAVTPAELLRLLTQADLDPGPYLHPRPATRDPRPSTRHPPPSLAHDP